MPPLIKSLAPVRSWVAISDRQPGGPPLDPVVARVALEELPALCANSMVPVAGTVGKCHKHMTISCDLYM
jgi:hypothetical protein